MPSQTPIFLLKTRSSPHDGYDDFLNAQGYNPTFIPVLEHRFNTQNLAQVRDLFASGAFELNESNANADTQNASQARSKKYGGMIFTSQRAVEGFARMIEQDGREFNSVRNTYNYKEEGEEEDTNCITCTQSLSLRAP